MKSLVINQRAFVNEVFLAFMRCRDIIIKSASGNIIEEVWIEGTVSSHYLQFTIKKFIKDDYKGGDWVIVYQFQVSKAEPQFNSIEATDIVDHVEKKFDELMYAYKVSKGYIDASGIATHIKIPGF